MFGCVCCGFGRYTTLQTKLRASKHNINEGAGDAFDLFTFVTRCTKSTTDYGTTLTGFPSTGGHLLKHFFAHQHHCCAFT